MNHLLVGAAFPFVIGVALYALARGRASLWLLLGVPAAMVACATWAVLPDLPRTFGFSGYDTEISMNPKIDIFFWHYTINQHESWSPLFSMGFVFMIVCLFIAAWRELKRAEDI